MQQVFQLLNHWVQPGPKAVEPRLPKQCLLTFDFVNAPTAPAVEPETYAPTARSLGRTESCLSSRNLSAAHCLDQADQHQSSSVVYLQKDARATLGANEPVPFRKVRRYHNPKVRATAMLDASEVLEIGRPNMDAYSLKRSETVISKETSLELVRRLSKRSSHEELLEKVKDACEKVSVQALANSPARRGHTAPLRHSIQIKIG